MLYKCITKEKHFYESLHSPNWSEEVFMIKKVKNNVPQKMLLMILTEKKLLEIFTKKNCKKKSKRI